MKKVKIFLLVLLSTLLFFNCRKNDDTKIDEVSNLSFTKKDKDYQDLAKVISVAINKNDDFRKLVKKEALKKFDGDYDILIKNFKNQKVASNSKSSTKISIGSLLSNYAKDLDIIKENKSSAQDYIDQLSQIYPNLQISVPVHADEWRDDYTPKVTFIPEMLNERQSINIPAYQNQQLTSVNSTIEPDEPVIVIGDNERIHPNNFNPNSDPIIISNWNLQGQTIPTGIQLSWTYSYNGTSPIIKYNIYRKGMYDNRFSRIGTSFGINNMTYNDNTTDSNAAYSYYVTASGIFEESNASNIIQIVAPDRPSELANFNAKVYASNEIGLYWTYPTNQYFDYMSLSKRVVNQGSQFNEIQQFNNNQFDFIDTNNNGGNKIIYKSQIVTNNHFSNPKYDIVVVPYRNISVPTKLFIKKVSFDDVSNVEPWIRGAPEFIVTLMKGDSSQNGEIIHRNIYLQFDHRTNSQNFNKELRDWLPDNWMEVYTFSMVEDDPATWTIDYNVSLGYQRKNEDKNNIFNGSFKFKISDIFGANDDQIGEAYLRYIDPPTKTLSFPDVNNTKLYVSDH